MRGCLTKTAAVAIVATAIAGCASTATPRVGYGGPPPLFKYQDGYAEDRSPYGPMPTNAGENSTIPGSRRYYWIPGSAEWYTFAGPNGPAGPAGSVGPAGPQGPQGIAGAGGSSGRSGIAGARGAQGASGRLVVESH